MLGWGYLVYLNEDSEISYDLKKHFVLNNDALVKSYL